MRFRPLTYKEQLNKLKTAEVAADVKILFHWMDIKRELQVATTIATTIRTILSVWTLDTGILSVWTLEVDSTYPVSILTRLWHPLLVVTKC